MGTPGVGIFIDALELSEVESIADGISSCSCRRVQGVGVLYSAMCVEISYH